MLTESVWYSVVVTHRSRPTNQTLRILMPVSQRRG